MKTANFTTCLAALTLCAVAQSAEFRLKVKNMDLEEARSIPGGYGAFGQFTLAKPDSIKRPVKAKSSRPLYSQLYRPDATEGRSGPDGMTLMLDESKGTGTAYDRLIADLNQNGDLTDDPILVETSNDGNVRSESLEQAVFGPVELPAESARGQWRPRFFVEVYLYNKEMLKSAGADQNFPIGQLRVLTANYLETVVELDGIRQRCGLIDGNCDFNLGDPATSRTVMRNGNRDSVWYLVPGDYWLRDRDGSGEFERSMTISDAEPFSGVIYFGLRPYQVQLDATLKSMRLEPYPDKLAELQIKPEIRQLIVGWQAKPGEWAALSPGIVGEKAMLPEGTHRLSSCVIGAKDREGNWLACASSETPDRLVQVKAAEPVKLDLGLPLDIEITAGQPRSANPWELTPQEKQREPTPTVVDINVVIRGAGGERYARFFNEGKSEPIPPPSFTIVGPNNRAVASGSFEYG